jgi:hypothetical protein
VVDEEWMVEHARQCSRMLPAGLAVVGVYVVAPEPAYAPTYPPPPPPPLSLSYTPLDAGVEAGTRRRRWR